MKQSEGLRRTQQSVTRAVIAKSTPRMQADPRMYDGQCRAQAWSMGGCLPVFRPACQLLQALPPCERTVSSMRR
jgi:hypothetical protein